MKLRACYIIGTVVAAYAVLPVLAGFFVWGDRMGPVIYPEDAHGTLYYIAYKLGGRGKQLSAASPVFENRPWF